MGCRGAANGKSGLKLQAKPGKPDKAKLDWKIQKGDETVLEDFLDPVAGVADYAVCVYDSSADAQPLMNMEVWPGGTCGPRDKPCWKMQGVKGYQYKDQSGAPSGVRQMQLVAGDAGKSSLRVQGKGIYLGLPQSLELTMPVTVQLVAQEVTRTECWQIMYSKSPKRARPNNFNVKMP